MSKKKLGISMKELLRLTVSESLNAEEDDLQKKVKELERENSDLREKLKKDSDTSEQVHTQTVEKRISEIYIKGVEYLKRDDLLKSIECFSAVLYFDPGNIKALNNSAIIFFELGLTEYAVKRLERIIEIDPDNKTAKENLGLMLTEDEL